MSDDRTASRIPESTRFEIVVSPWEARMSLWIETPTLRERASGTTLFGFRDANWSLDEAAWRSDGVVELWLRKYPGSHAPSQLRVVIDCEARTACVGEARIALDALESALERELHWPPPADDARPQGWRRVLARLYRLWRGRP